MTPEETIDQLVEQVGPNIAVPDPSLIRKEAVRQARATALTHGAGAGLCAVLLAVGVFAVLNRDQVTPVATADDSFDAEVAAPTTSAANSLQVDPAIETTPTSGVPSGSMSDVMLLATPSDVFYSERFESIAASYADRCNWSLNEPTGGEFANGVDISVEHVDGVLTAIDCEGSLVVRSSGEVLAGELSPGALARLEVATTDLPFVVEVDGPATAPSPGVAPVDIVTGEPEGGAGMQALSSFTLKYDPDLNCLYHDEPDKNGEPGAGGRVVVVWPAEYTAVRDTPGVAVLNPAGHVVARSGETFQIAGGGRGGGSGHCDSIGEWIANGGPISQAEPESNSTTTTAPPTTTISPSAPEPSTWLEFSSWDAGNAFSVDGVEVGDLGTRHECFDGECGSPMDYWATDDFVVPVGATLQFGDQDLGQDDVVIRQLTSDLSFEGIPGSSPVVLLEPGIYHIDVKVDANFESVEGLTQVRQFMWLQVVDPAAPCVSGGATSVTVTGAVDAEGCPTQSAKLDIVSLHPEFHCFPWPATIEIGPRRYLRNQFNDSTIEVADRVPDHFTRTAAFVESGEVLVSSLDPDAVFVSRDDGVVEIWRVAEEQVGCA